jgi:hypothetical protein
MRARPAAGGGRWVDVTPERLPGWIDRFTARHGFESAWGTVPAAGDGSVRLVGLDGSVAEFAPPPGAPPAADLDTFVGVAQAPRRLGLLLARQASAAIGIADGDRLVASKVDTSYVQGRTAAGGWSQQRFARRRVNQARAAAESAADVVGRILLPASDDLAAVVCGGDRRTVEAILADDRLVAVAALRSERFLDVPEPRLAVLENAVAAARAVRILVRDPPAPTEVSPS